MITDHPTLCSVIEPEQEEQHAAASECGSGVFAGVGLGLLNDAAHVAQQQ